MKRKAKKKSRGVTLGDAVELDDIKDIDMDRYDEALDNGHTVREALQLAGERPALDPPPSPPPVRRPKRRAKRRRPLIGSEGLLGCLIPWLLFLAIVVALAYGPQILWIIQWLRSL